MLNKILLIYVILLSACSLKVYDVMSWQKETVEVDGKTIEWKLPLRYYDADSQLNYEFSNDSENLYLAVRTANNTTIQNILLAGLRVEIDTVVKPQIYPFSLQYPILDNLAQDYRKGPPGYKVGEEEYSKIPPMDFEERRFKNSNNSDPRNDRILLGGFNGREDEEEVFHSSETSGIAAQFYIDSLGYMFYEAKFPFSTFYKNFISRVDTATVFRLKISLEKLVQDQKPGPPENNRGEVPSEKGSPGMGGPPGRSGGPRMSGGPSPGARKEPLDQNSYLKDKVEITHQFQLSYQ